MDIQIQNTQDLSFEKVWQMFQETDKKFQETRAQMLETDKKIKELSDNIGGIAKSNGLMAEEYFYSAFANTMKVGNMKFDYIDYNMKRKHKKLEAQYDIILYNKYKVLIVEVKYNFRIKQLREFYEKSISKFRKLFPQYKTCKLYSAIAGMTIPEETILEAENFGFLVITQNADKLQLLNSSVFQPKEF